MCDKRGLSRRSVVLGGGVMHRETQDKAPPIMDIELKNAILGLAFILVPIYVVYDIACLILS